MNKRGFTLIEVVITISILILIISIAVPSIITLNTTQSKKQQARVYKTIENAAQVYVTNHPDEVTFPYNIQLESLISTGLLEDKIIDPVTKQKLDPNSLIKVDKKADNELVFTYPFIFVIPPDNTPPVITLTKSTDSVRQGTTVDFNSYVVSVTDDRSVPILTINSSSFNSNVVGSYDIVYTATDEVGNNAIVTLTITVTPVYIANDITLPTGCTENAGTYSGTCYFTGANPNNYVWYSGFLWRMIKIESDGSIKMITQDPLSAIGWGEAKYSYQNSYIRSWLNDLSPTDSLDGIFYLSLKTPTNFLVNSTWDISLHGSASSPSAYTDYIGLISSKEYNLAGGSSSYLNIGSTWATLTYTRSLCSTGDVGKYVVTSAGALVESAETAVYGQASGCSSVENHSAAGIRPVVVLKNSLKKASGTGISTDPYRITNDNSGSNGDSLNTRFAGEYISYSGSIWRISNVANSRTRVVLNDFLRSGASILKKAYDTRDLGSYTCGPYVQTARYDTSASTSIAYYLNNTYFNSLTSNNYIYATSSWHNSVWGDGANYTTAFIAKAQEVYTHTYCSSTFNTTFYYTDVTAKIGIASVGEMFSGNDMKISLCGSDCYRAMATQDSYFISYSLRTLSLDGTTSGSSYPSSTSLIYRPSFEFKSGVKISGGAGTLSNPYTITCTSC